MQDITKKAYVVDTLSEMGDTLIPKSPSRPISHFLGEVIEEGAFKPVGADITDSDQHLFEKLPDYGSTPVLYVNPHTLLPVHHNPNDIFPIQQGFGVEVSGYVKPVIAHAGIVLGLEPVYQRPPNFGWHEPSHLENLPPEPHIKSEVLEGNSTLLTEMLSKIDSLLENKYDWDDIDYKHPTLEDMKSAKVTLTKFVKVITYSGHSLTEPDIFNSEDGGATIEWHLDNRSLYLRLDCSKSVATKIEDEDSETTTIVDMPFEQKSYLPLWKWIINE